MKKFGKKYTEASKKVDKNKLYTVEEAVKLVKETSITRFDGTVELAFEKNISSFRNIKRNGEEVNEKV